MKLFKNKKGLAQGIFVIMVVMFVSAFLSLLSLVMAQEFYDTIDQVPNETISPEVKDKIVDNTGFMFWGDKIFTMFFIVLLIAYLISSSTLEVQRPIMLLLFFGFLVLVTFIAMWLSNSWTYVLQDPRLAAAATHLKFTDYFMRYLPYITFITGIAGAVIFYGRKTTSFSEGGGETSGIE